ncbi:MAG TPA: response regulator [Thermoanaerobaculia bacterium]
MTSESRSALLVEDDPDFAQILVRLLKPWRLEVVSTATLEEAMSIVSQRSFDLYTIDLQLADDDAAPLLAWLASQGEEIASRCITLTAHDVIARIFTGFPIVSKTKLSLLGPELLRILGDPFKALPSRSHTHETDRLEESARQ